MAFRFEGPPGLETFHRDGYRVELELHQGRDTVLAQLLGRLVAGGEEQDEVILWQAEAPRAEEGLLTARARRLERLVQELGRYLNLGGAREDATEAANALFTLLPEFTLPGLIYVKSEEEEPRQHLFLVEQPADQPVPVQLVDVIEDHYAVIREPD